MKSLKDRIDEKREEVADKTYRGQRSCSDENEIDALKETVATLQSRVEEQGMFANYHDAEQNGQEAAIGILVEEIDRLHKHIRNITARLIHDEELIGIGDEDDHCLGQDLTVMSTLDHHADILDELEAGERLRDLTFDKKVDDLHTLMQRELQSLQDHINRKLPKCE